MNPYITYLTEVKKAYLREGVSLPYNMESILNKSVSTNAVADSIALAQSALEGYGFMQDVLSVCDSAYAMQLEGMSGEVLYKDRLRESFMAEFKARVDAEQKAQLEDLPEPERYVLQGSQIPILGVFGRLDPAVFLVEEPEEDKKTTSTQTPEQRSQIMDYFSSVLQSSDEVEVEEVTNTAEEEVIQTDSSYDDSFSEDSEDSFEDFEELEMEELATLEEEAWENDEALTDPMGSLTNLAVDESFADELTDDLLENAAPAEYNAQFCVLNDNSTAEEDEFDNVSDEDDWESSDDSDEEDSFDSVSDEDNWEGFVEEATSNEDFEPDEGDGWNNFSEEIDDSRVENINDEAGEFVFSDDFDSIETPEESETGMELFSDFDSMEDEDDFDAVEDEEDSFDSVEDEDDFDSVEDEDDFDSATDEEDGFDSVEDEDDFDSVEGEDSFDVVTDDDFDSVEDEDDFDSVEDEEGTFDSVEDEDDFDAVEDEDGFDSVEDDDSEFDIVEDDESEVDENGDYDFSLFDNLEDDGEDWGEGDTSAEEDDFDNVEPDEDEDAWDSAMDDAISAAMDSLMPSADDDYFEFSEDAISDDIAESAPDLNAVAQIPSETGNNKQNFDEALADALEKGVTKIFSWGKQKFRGSQGNDSH